MKEDELRIMFPLAFAEMNDMIRNCRDKYPDDDVQRRVPNVQVLGKMFSHISKWHKGCDGTGSKDVENGQEHMASIAFWALVMLERDLVDHKEADREP